MKAKGFILITALGVAVLVLILGLGISYLAQTNLEIAANLRSNTQARYNAEAGIDHSLVFLRANGNSNTAPSQTLSGNGYSQGSSGYSVTITPADGASSIQTSNLLSVVSTGYAPRDGEYKATAIISPQVATTQTAITGPTPPSTIFPGITAQNFAALDARTTFVNGAGVYVAGSFASHGLVNGTIYTQSGSSAAVPIPAGADPMGDGTPPAQAVGVFQFGPSATPSCTQPVWACSSSLRAARSIPSKSYAAALTEALVRGGVIPAGDTAQISSSSSGQYASVINTYCSGRTILVSNAGQLSTWQTLLGGSLSGSGPYCLSASEVPSGVNLSNKTLIFIGSTLLRSSQTFSNSLLIASGTFTLDNNLVLPGNGLSMLAEGISYNGGSRIQGSGGNNLIATRQALTIGGDLGNPSATGCSTYAELVSDATLTLNQGIKVCGQVYASTLLMNGDNEIYGGVAVTGSLTLGTGSSTNKFYAPIGGFSTGTQRQTQTTSRDFSQLVLVSRK